MWQRVAGDASQLRPQPQSPKHPSRTTAPAMTNYTSDIVVGFASAILGYAVGIIAHMAVQPRHRGK